jgi:cell division protein FtsI (penicillin-binding protein 3)
MGVSALTNDGLLIPPTFIKRSEGEARAIATLSPRTMMWSRHFRRIDPITRSAKPVCQGEAGAIDLSRMPWRAIGV